MSLNSAFRGRKEDNSKDRQIHNPTSVRHQLTVKKERSPSAVPENERIFHIQSRNEEKEDYMSSTGTQGYKAMKESRGEDNKAGILDTRVKTFKRERLNQGDDQDKEKLRLQRTLEDAADKDEIIFDYQIQLATAAKRETQMKARIAELKAICRAGDHPIDIGIIAIPGETSTAPFAFAIPLPFAAATVIPPAYDYSRITRLNRGGRASADNKGKKRQREGDEL